MLTSAIAAHRSMASTAQQTMLLSNLAIAYTDLGQLDDAWRCIGEAMTAVESTKERWCEAEINRVAGEKNSAQVAGTGCGESGSVFRACAGDCACSSKQSPGNSAQQ